MPFIKTAVLGSSGASVLNKAGYVYHLGLVRLQLRGSGVLRTTAYSMDEENSATLPNLTMVVTDNVYREIKSNFKEQQFSLEIETTSIDEIFRISKIIIFVNPLWASLPG